jgi:hypothetical protein
MVSSSFITRAELEGYVNNSGGELWDILMTRYEDYTTTPEWTQFSLSGSNYQYTLPADCVKIRGVEYYDVGDWSTLKRYTLEDRDRWRDTQWRWGSGDRRYTILGSRLSFVPEDEASGQYRFRYIQAWTTLTGSSQTVSLPNGWEEYLVVDAAIKCKQKEESDTAALEMRKAGLLRRIEAASSNRDAGEQEFLTDPNDLRLGGGW